MTSAQIFVSLIFLFNDSRKSYGVPFITEVTAKMADVSEL